MEKGCDSFVKQRFGQMKSHRIPNEAYDVQMTYRRKTLTVRPLMISLNKMGRRSDELLKLRPLFDLSG